MKELRGRFLGIRQQHSYNLYYHFDKIITGSNLQKFIEIGTGNGAMSLFLGLYAFQRNTSLWTFDKQERGDLHLAKPFFDLLRIQMILGDVFTQRDHIAAFVKDSPTFIFCDNGDKIKEVAYFKPILSSGSIIAVHDYPKEIGKSHVDSTGLIPVKEKDWPEMKTMVWKVQ